MMLDSAPQTLPLKTPEQLDAFHPAHVDDYHKPSVPLQQGGKAGRQDGPRLLACHDMRGGYLEDRLVQGGHDSEFYYFRHWHAVDVFVYFSHHLVTIPPVGWINAGHRHGVPVLGTFITEWEQGAVYCDRIFGSEEAAERSAAQLAAVCQTYAFDGWVINIENKLKPDHVPNMLHFLRTLSGTLQSLSTAMEVVWYDAVTVEGELKWQDTLNDLNRPFFEASTALWVNYTWKEGTPAEVAARAGDRRGDVFMGVDVFGRGTYGGGGFSCDLALQAARDAGLSAALFAIAWPFDAAHPPEDYPSWQQRDEVLWRSIAAAWPGGRPICAELPLHTDFCVGAGRSSWLKGNILHDASWYNLSRQGLQPSLILSTLSDSGRGSSWPSINRCAGGSPASSTGATDAAAGSRPASSTGATDTAAGSRPASSIGATDTAAVRLSNVQHGLQAAMTQDAAYVGGSCLFISGSVGACHKVSLLRTSIPFPAVGLEVGCVTATSTRNSSSSSRNGALPVLALTLAAAGGEGTPDHGAPAGHGRGHISAESVPGLPETGSVTCPGSDVEGGSTPSDAAAGLQHEAGGFQSPVILLLPAERPDGHTQQQLQALAAVLGTGADSSHRRHLPPSEDEQMVRECCLAGSSAASRAPSLPAVHWHPAQQQEQREPCDTGNPMRQDQPNLLLEARDAPLHWVQHRHSVQASCLPAPSEDWQILSVDLILVPGQDSAEASLYLGELWLVDARNCLVAPSNCISGLAFSQLHLSRSEAGILLSAVLHWDMANAVHCCHVYCSYSDSSGGQPHQQMLGVAVGSSFCVHALQAAASYTFAVVPLSNVGGLVERWDDAATVKLILLDVLKAMG